MFAPSLTQKTQPTLATDTIRCTDKFARLNAPETIPARLCGVIFGVVVASNSSVGVLARITNSVFGIKISSAFCALTLSNLRSNCCPASRRGRFGEKPNYRFLA